MKRRIIHRKIRIPSMGKGLSVSINPAKLAKAVRKVIKSGKTYKF